MITRPWAQSIGFGTALIALCAVSCGPGINSQSISTAKYPLIRAYIKKQVEHLNRVGGEQVEMVPVPSPEGGAILLRGFVADAGAYKVLRVLVGNPIFNPDVPSLIIWNVTINESNVSKNASDRTRNFPQIQTYINAKLPFLQKVGFKHIDMTAAPSSDSGVIVLKGYVNNTDEYKFLQVLLNNLTLNPDPPATIVWDVTIAEMNQKVSP